MNMSEKEQLQEAAELGCRSQGQELRSSKTQRFRGGFLWG